MKPITNHAKSIKDKLLNLMRNSGKEYMYLLARYFNERLLYRISISRYRDNFILKGGSLLYALDGLNARPTVDIDVLCMYINREQEALIVAIREILGLKCEEDGVIFDLDSIVPTPIAVDKKYPGTRFSFKARMDSIVHNMSIDIGFGDVIVPSPQIIDFPLLIPSLPSVNITAYSVETVIAEKFHAMIDRDVANSRMKDFFDCYMLLNAKTIDDDILYDAIRETFNNRKLLIKSNLQLFSKVFYEDKNRLVGWRGFLKKIKWKEVVTFEDVMNVIASRLQPMYERYVKEQQV